MNKDVHYSLEACLLSLRKSQYNSLVKLKFSFLFFRLFATGFIIPVNKDYHHIIQSIMSLTAHLRKYSTLGHGKKIIDVYLDMFNCLPAQQVIALRKRKFLRKKFSITDNVLCRVCADNAVKEMSSLS